MGYHLCKECGRYHFDDVKCKDIYKVCSIEKNEVVTDNIDDYDCIKVRANSFKEASEEYAMWLESNYNNLVGEEVDCVVENLSGERNLG